MSVAQELAARLEAVAQIDDPFTGKADPQSVKAFSRAWPLSEEWARVRLFKVSEGEGRRIEEYRYVPAAGGAEQPVAVVFATEGGVAVARIYARHQWVEDRADVLPVDAAVTYGTGPEDVMTRYFAAIGSADMEASLAPWAADGYIQHSNGDTYQGAERLRQDFTKFFASGPIRLKYCNVLDTGETRAFECYMPSGRPAIAIYDRSADNRLKAARLYL